MSDYDSLAALRQALSADDPDQRANAYGAVMQLDVKPSEVLTPDPDDEVVQNLVDEGVIPERTGGPNRQPANQQRARIIELLEEIASNTGGS